MGMFCLGVFVTLGALVGVVALLGWLGKWTIEGS